MNLHYSSKILKVEYGIGIDLKSIGHSMLINHNEVPEQYVHSDFHDDRRHTN